MARARSLRSFTASEYNSPICVRCYYPLIGLANCICPECGRHFDLAVKGNFTTPREETLNRIVAWTWFGFFLAITPFALLLGLASCGAGHGDYQVASVLFSPSVSLIDLGLGTVGECLAIVQYPLYGIVMAIGQAKRRIWLACLVLCTVHLGVPVIVRIARSLTSA